MLQKMKDLKKIYTERFLKMFHYLYDMCVPGGNHKKKFKIANMKCIFRVVLWGNKGFF